MAKNRIETRKSYRFWTALTKKITEIIEESENPEIKIAFLWHILTDMRRMYGYDRTSKWYHESLQYIADKLNTDINLLDDYYDDYYEFIRDVTYENSKTTHTEIFQNNTDKFYAGEIT